MYFILHFLNKNEIRIAFPVTYDRLFSSTYQKKTTKLIGVSKLKPQPELLRFFVFHTLLNRVNSVVQSEVEYKHFLILNQNEPINLSAHFQMAKPF